jgi:hypothetical protein
MLQLTSTSFASFNNYNLSLNNNDYLSDNDWGYFIDFEDDFDNDFDNQINKSICFKLINVEKKNPVNPAINLKSAINFKSAINLKPTINFKSAINLKSDINVNPTINLKSAINVNNDKKEENYNLYKKEEKIIQIYNQIYNCLINSVVTISIIYFITKL